MSLVACCGGQVVSREIGQKLPFKSARWLLLKNRDSLRAGEDIELEELHVARHYELDWKTVKELDRACLERTLGPVDLDGVEVVIGMEEFAIQKGHRYATVIVEPRRKRVLWIVPRVRVACEGCGPKLERLAWLDAYARVTRRLADSVSRLCQVGIPPLRHFAKKLRPDLAGILAHCRYPLRTNLIEGINNKIKVVKRVAYGFRDDAYFFLKIRAAFPGVRR